MPERGALESPPPPRPALASASAGRRRPRPNPAPSAAPPLAEMQPRPTHSCLSPAAHGTECS